MYIFYLLADNSNQRRLTSEESETKSFGVSGRSGCRRESQESDAGVRGRGLKALGFGDI